MNKTETFQLFCKYCQCKFESLSPDRTYQLVREHEMEKHENSRDVKVKEIEK